MQAGKISIIFLASALLISCKFHPPKGNSTIVPSHKTWDELLKKYVDEDGWVDYKGFISDSIVFNQYLNKLRTSPPDPERWSREDQLAYWINVYNAFTVKLITEHYPVSSIKDIGSAIQIPFVNSPFDIKFIDIGGMQLDLNNIEHDIIREKFDEPRIHFAVNCASVSCPKLRNKAYTGARLDQQLTDQARDFINDPNKNEIKPDHIMVSKIFQWYSSDFTHSGSLIDFLNQYSETRIHERAEIDYLDYNWRLNER